MKRDMELARKILLALEDCDESYAPQELEIEGATEQQVMYHLGLLALLSRRPCCPPREITMMRR